MRIWRTLVNLVLALLICSPALAMDAEYLIFRAGAERTLEVARTKPGFVKGADVMVEWHPVNGDRLAWNYRRLPDNTVIYDPPETPSTPVADPKQFIRDCLADSAIKASQLPAVFTLAELADHPVALQMRCAEFSKIWPSTDTGMAKMLFYAQKANLPIK